MTTVVHLFQPLVTLVTMKMLVRLMTSVTIMDNAKASLSANLFLQMNAQPTTLVLMVIGFPHMQHWEQTVVEVIFAGSGLVVILMEFVAENEQVIVC
jgi:hypothetical protein